MTIFSRIIAGEIPCYKVAEDDRFFAFLDINPMSKGHTLVVPKQETDYLFDLDDNMLADMMVFAKKVAASLQKHMDCVRVGAEKMLFIPISDIHIGAIGGSFIADNTYNKSVVMERMKKLVTRIIDEINIYNVQRIVVADLGDSLDGYNG